MSTTDIYAASSAAARSSTAKPEPRDAKEAAEMARANKLFGAAGSGGLTHSRGHAITAGVFDAREQAARASGDRDRAAQLARDRKGLVNWAVKCGVTELELTRLTASTAPHIEARERSDNATAPSGAGDRASYERQRRATAEAIEAMPARVTEQLRERHGDGAGTVIARAKTVVASIEAASPLIGTVLKYSGAGNDRDVIEILAGIGSRIAK